LQIWLKLPFPIDKAHRLYNIVQAVTSSQLWERNTEKILRKILGTFEYLVRVL